jgi:hypothetical protein
VGAWGAAIFSDDTAADVRDSFRDLIGDGLSPEEATRRLIAEYASSVDDAQDGPPLWLGLAVTQWKCGRLQEDVKARALQVIDSGLDLARWSGNAKLVRAREAVLAKTRELLLSAQPPPRRIGKRFRQTNDWNIGELVSYRTVSGQYVVLRVLGHHVDKGGTAPEMDLLDYYADVPASPEAAATLAPRPMVEKHPDAYTLTRRFMVGATSAREIPTDRLQRLGVRAPATEPVTRDGTRVLLWRPGRPVSLDTFIARVMPGPLIWRSGPGGDDHRRWQMGDVFACLTDSGKHPLLQVIDRYRGAGLDDAPVVAVLDALPESVPALAEVPARAVWFSRTPPIGFGFVLVNDGTDAVPASALTAVGNRAPVADRVVQVFVSVPMALRQVERTIGLRAAAGRSTPAPEKF